MPWARALAAGERWTSAPRAKDRYTPPVDDAHSTLDQGRYRLIETLGRGGMATVYRAYDTRLDVERAIKVLHPELTHHSEARQRFEDEARTLARLHHEHLVTVHDVGFDGERLFIVMEWLPSGSLDVAVRERGPLPIEEAVAIVDGVLAGLGHAHAHGVIHRDVKPQNVLLTAGGAARLADFGIARADNRDAGMTRAGAMMGTFAYMAPEQRQSATYAEPRTDLYAVAATFYAILTGKQPVDLHVSEGHAMALRDLPEPVRAFIIRGTRFHAEDRFDSAETMRVALRELVHTAGGLEPLPSRVLSAIDEPRDSDTFEWTTDGLDEALSEGAAAAASAISPTGAAIGTAAAQAAITSASSEVTLAEGRPMRVEELPTILDGEATSTSGADRSGRMVWVGALLAVAGLFVAGELARRVLPGAPAESVAWHTDVVFTGSGVMPLGPEITPGQVGQWMWRIRSEGGVPVELTRVNGVDRIWHQDEVAETRWPPKLFLVREEGVLRAFEERNEVGSVTHRMAVTQVPGGIEVSHQTASGAWDLVPLSLDLRYPDFPDGDAPAIERYTLDGNGRLAEGRWFNAAGQPTLGPDGAWGARYTWDESGRPLRRTAIDDRGEPMFSQGGVIHALWTYEEEPPSTTVRFEAFGGVRVFGPQGAHATKTTRDEHGRVVRIEHFDPEMKPVLHAYYMCATQTFSWEEGRAAYTCLDVDGGAIDDKWDCVTRETLLDERHYPRQRRCLDEAGSPKERRYWSTRDIAFDDLGRLVRDGPLLRWDGVRLAAPDESEQVAAVEYAYGPTGKVAEVRTVGDDGTLTLGASGSAIVRNVYEDDRLVERRWYGTDSLPILNASGYAAIRQRWDERGYRVEYATLDTVGRPVMSTRGWARLEESFDEAGRSTRYALFDGEGKPVRGEEGYASREQTVEGSVRTTLMRDESGALVVGKDHYAKMVEVLDARGLVVEQRYFDADGAPILQDDGEIGMLASYDAGGRLVEARLLGDPSAFTTTCALRVHGYDARGNLTHVGCRTAEGERVGQSSDPGVSDVYASYEVGSWGRLIWYESPEGKRVANAEGCYEVRHVYDLEGEQTTICVPPSGGGEGEAIDARLPK